MPQVNPYEVLKVPQDADIDAIEDAYDRLFDKYEPRAQAGDAGAIAMLERLNEARETLLEPAQRAEIDAGLAAPKSAKGNKTNLSPSPSLQATTRIRPGSVTKQAENKPRSEVSSAGSKTRRSAPRPRAVAPAPSRSLAPMLAVAAIFLLALAVGVAYLVARGNTASATQDTSRGKAVATVNGQPVYDQDYQEQISIDKAKMLADPLYGSLVNNFQGITGTRMLDVLSSDALDKMVNMEVLRQQAQKESIYPSEAQQAQVIQASKQTEVPNGDFQAFLDKNHITEAQYNRRVINNFVYLAMVTAHMPSTGTADDRTNAFIKWMCDTRKNYDVKILVTFKVPNTPCTSGLPSDYPIPGLDNQQAPEAQPTSQAPITPGGNSTPAPTLQPTQAKP